MKYYVHDKSGFTLVEIMIVVAIIGLLATIAYPAANRARIRSQEASCLDQLRVIDGAKTQFGFDNGTSPTTLADLVPYFVKNYPTCPAGGLYTIGTVLADPECSIGGGHVL